MLGVETTCAGPWGLLPLLGDSASVPFVQATPRFTQNVQELVPGEITHFLRRDLLLMSESVSVPAIGVYHDLQFEHAVEMRISGSLSGGEAPEQ